MGLRTQLLIVALTLLLLPWAGCNYVQEMEDVLRTNQAEAVTDQAQLITHFVKRRLVASRATERHRFYTPIRYQPVQVDGYDDDWQSHVITELRPLPAPAFTENQAVDRVFLQKALYQERLYLFLNVKTSAIHYYRPGDKFVLSDYLQLDLSELGNRKRLVFFTSGPGPIQAFSWEADRDQLRVNETIQAWREETSEGYTVEISIPQSEMLDTFDISLFSPKMANQPSQLWATTQQDNQPSYWLKPIEELSDDLTPYRSLKQDVVVVDHEGWPLTVQRDWLSESILASERTLPRGLINTGLSRLYRTLINRLTPSSSHAFWPLSSVNLSAEQDQIKLSNLPLKPPLTLANWYQLEDSPQAALLVVQPVMQNTQVIAYVILSQTSDALISLTNDALRTVTHRTLLILLFVVAVLVLFASVLSWRIRRLNHAIEVAIEQEGVHNAFKPSQRSDEVGDLSRSFNTLLQRIQQHTDYLATLNSKLAHELRTPLAIVKSSLEMVKCEPESAIYLQRAEDGSERLRRILSAMSEASRVEQTIQQSDFENFDVSHWLQELAQAYADTYSDHHFPCQLDIQPAFIKGSPELLAQMLDKLVDNARSFAPSNTDIRFHLHANQDTYYLDVENSGPPLPVNIEGQLFDSLVTERQSRSPDTSHLGLGLYIVRLICSAHGGRVSAHNTDPNTTEPAGVLFRIELPIWKNPD